MTARDIFDGVLVVALIVALYAAVGEPEYQEELILKKHIAEASERKQFPACDGATLKSWGAAERWNPKTAEQEPECAPSSRQLPNHILTSPIGEGK